MPADPLTPLPVRASDRERDLVARTLRDHAAEGRISLETFAGRLERVHEARDCEQLRDVVRDLPPRSRFGRLVANVVGFASQVAHDLELAWSRPRVPRVDLPSDRDLVAIGRAAGCDLRVADEFVSRRHAQLRRTPRGWVIEDAGSANGTRVNGIRVIGATPISNGDLISLADVHVRVGKV